MTHNWTLEDFYAGKVALKYDSEDINSLRRITKMEDYNGDQLFYWFTKDDTGEIINTCGMNLPDKFDYAPISYFVSLLNAQEAQLEYIYEPFNEEAAKNGAVVVNRSSKKEVKFIYFYNNRVSIILNDELATWHSSNFQIRRTVETKEVKCYVYADGTISSCKIVGSLCGKIIETFTHTIKIPKK